MGFQTEPLEDKIIELENKIETLEKEKSDLETECEYLRYHHAILYNGES